MGQQEPGKGWSGWAAVHGVGLVSTPTQLPPAHAQDGSQTQHSPPAVCSYFGKKNHTKKPNPKPSKQKPKQLHENKVNIRN